MSHASANNPHAENPVTPFGPVDPEIRNRQKAESLDALAPQSPNREELLCNASRCLYEGLKSLMEAVAHEQKVQEVPTARIEQQAQPFPSASLEDPFTSPTPESLEELSMSEELSTPEGTDSLENVELDDATIACWTEEDMENMPEAIPGSEGAEDDEENTFMDSMGPISPFAQTTSAQAGWQGGECPVEPSKITPISKPLSLTELQPAAEAPEVPSSAEGEGGNFFSVVEKPSEHTAPHLTPDSIPSGEGTPAGPDSVTDPLDGEKAFEIPKQILSFKKAGLNPFQNTIPSARSKKKAG